MKVAALISLLISLPFLYILARRPILRRLALRNAMRRPREALLVVLGSLLGAAIITGSAVVGDTMDSSIRQGPRQHLGPIDELVLAQDAPEWRSLSGRLRSLPASKVDGVLQLATLDAPTTAGRAETFRSVPNSQVVAVDFNSARAFGRDPASTGIQGMTPEPGHAAITTDLARGLNVGSGAQIDVYAYGRPRTLTVDRIVPRVGVAGFSLGDQQEARNVLVSPATFGTLLRGGVQTGAPPVWMVAVSNRGGVESGAQRTDEVDRAIRQAAGGLDPEVRPIKQQVLEVADQVGKGFTQMFTAMGSFGVLAGLLLLVNLFVMLAAERKSELGMARAVGMRRSALVGAFATEGFLYALFQGYLAMGLLVGIAGIAVVMVRAVRERRRQIGTLRALGFPAQSVGRSFAIEAGYVALQGTVIGVLLALLTLYTIVTRSDAMGDLQFAVPIAQLSILLAATVAASLLATVGPALSATRIRPAVALRMTGS